MSKRVKRNCWEVVKCGREPGGARAGELGVCPAAAAGELDGVHGGKNAGRCCWVVAGTMCGGEVQGVFASKCLDCMRCEFYKEVAAEEGEGLRDAYGLLKKANRRT